MAAFSDAGLSCYVFSACQPLPQLKSTLTFQRQHLGTTFSFVHRVKAFDNHL
jgi:hypothetical protein